MVKYVGTTRAPNTITVNEIPSCENEIPSMTVNEIPSEISMRYRNEIPIPQ